MDVDDGIEMITQIYEKQKEERYFTLYATQYPNMTKDNFIQFEEFYKPQKKHEVVEEKTAEQIIKEVREMLNSHSVGGEN